MGNLPAHIYGYSKEHDVIVYTVVKDTQSECGQPHHRFQKSPFWFVYTETQPQSFQTKTGAAAFLKSPFSSSVNDRRIHIKGYQRLCVLK